jgi:osmoprotectant transport system permease protein
MIALGIRLVVLVLLVAFLVTPQSFAPLFVPLTQNGAPPIYNQGALIDIALSHLGIVAITTLASTIVAVGLAIFVSRPAGAEFLPLSRSIANVGQTFPPIAVLALAVPVLGFGAKPTLVALFLYGLLPIFENALVGLTTLPPVVMDAADGMGMTPLQKLWRVELPLAFPIILSGIRLSAVISMGTATIGSTVAAKTLGEVIIAGLTSSNFAFVLQGGMIVAVLAVLVSDAFGVLERWATKRAGQQRPAEA